MEWKHSPSELLQALNAHLPLDVAARSIQISSPGFHPRYDAVSRCYRYYIFCDPQRSPLNERYAWRVWPGAELPRLQEAASLLVGEHDFSAFGSPPRPDGKTMRTVSRAEWFEEGPLVEFEIVSQAFLYHMVRRLVSFQVEIGQGRRQVEQLSGCLEAASAEMVQGLAPAHGLVLVEVRYGKERSGEAGPANLDNDE
jgi:tRNA pseudouridine38-40 synthase